MKKLPIVLADFFQIYLMQKSSSRYDIRLSSHALKAALVKGLIGSGCNVIDIGQCGTEMIYFATAHLKLDGGVMITASHNPKEYNGMKFVRQEECGNV